MSPLRQDDYHGKLRAQIRAGRELLDMKQSDLADSLGASLSKISRAENGETKSGDVLLELKHALEEHGVCFTTNGVELADNLIQVLEGDGCYLRLLDTMYQTLIKMPEQERDLRIMYASDRMSPPIVNDRYRFMRKNGIKMRQLIEEGDHYIMGHFEEYRTIPSAYFTNVVTLAYENKVAQVDSDVTRVVIHHDKKMALREKNIFAYLWDMGKKPEKTKAKERF